MANISQHTSVLEPAQLKAFLLPTSSEANHHHHIHSPRTNHRQFLKHNNNNNNNNIRAGSSNQTHSNLINSSPSSTLSRTTSIDYPSSTSDSSFDSFIHSHRATPPSGSSDSSPPRPKKRSSISYSKLILPSSFISSTPSSISSPICHPYDHHPPPNDHFNNLLIDSFILDLIHCAHLFGIQDELVGINLL